MSLFWNIKTLTPLLLQAASQALQKQKNLSIYEKKPSPTKTEVYTNADVEIEQLFTKAFNKPQKNCFFIGEESVKEYIKEHPMEKILKHTTFVVDPIDGTLNYLNNLPNWGISIGLIENQTITQGAIVLPRLGEIFISENNKVYYAQIPKSLEEIPSDYAVTYHELKTPQTHKNKSYEMYAASYANGPKKAKTRNSFHTNRSCVYSITKVLTGSYFGYACKAKLWDLAGCIGLFKNANAPLYYIKENTLHNFSFEVTEELWKSKISAQYDIVFAHNKEYAQTLLPRE